jgi:hypothetical protein
VARTTLPIAGMPNAAPVDAVEITWSNLTYGIKDAQLIYDFTERDRAEHLKKPEDPNTQDMSCFWSGPAATQPSTVPARVSVNALIKESTLDRSLADAILYAGPFNRILQHAVAEGLCDAITLAARQPTPDTVSSACNWNQAQTVLDRRDTVYVVVTHSLGSRMLYSVLINLNGQNWYGDSAFDIAANQPDAPAAKTISAFTCQMPVVYMMANQFSLLGLASAGTVANIIADDPKSESVSEVRAFLPGLTDDDASIKAKNKIDPIKCSSNGAHDVVPSGSKPTFVAFTDPNDLLSWSIRSDMDTGNFEFFNVFVDNRRWHWLGLYEDAASAHSGYFNNKDVGRLIACGVEKSNIRSACDPSTW